MRRPHDLTPLFKEISGLKGVGPKTAARIEKLVGGAKLVHLLWHLPTALVDRRAMPPLAEAAVDRIATFRLTVEAHEPGSGPRRPYRIRCRDATGECHLIFFHGRAEYLKREYPVGDEVIVSGKLERFRDDLQIAHPDAWGPVVDLDRIAIVEPVYGLTGGLTGKTLRGAVGQALAALPDLPDWLDPAHKAREAWPDWPQAMRAAHAPEKDEDLLPSALARRRLAYDELLATQLAVGLLRRAQTHRQGRSWAASGALRARIVAGLPFALTPAQRAALADIDHDLAQPTPMARLVQGDVGSGKTVVALLAMASVVEGGGQAALMAPTEILAQQHAETLRAQTADTEIAIEVLTGRDTGKTRQAKLDRIADGTADILIGTHALFQQDVAFQDLGLVVIDEQHRFGVHQRVSLTNKGRAVDTLAMTATPIPRTLVLTAYGDLESSRLTDKPPGRQPVDTRVLPGDRLAEVIAAIGRQIEGGGQVYWVCPLVEEDEASETAAVDARFAMLRDAFGDRVAMVHGRMKPQEKDKIMRGFAAGETAVLVATTVIEVGVNVPNATVMVIEHAERFGLSQLHQLRGRVGRGDKPSTCLLLYRGPLSETAGARLQTLRRTEDGFLIAEEDLRLRGGGDVMGTRQSGVPSFRLADLTVHADLIETARDDARLILATDPELASPRGEALRRLLYLFERDQAAQYLRAG